MVRLLYKLHKERIGILLNIARYSNRLRIHQTCNFINSIIIRQIRYNELRIRSFGSLLFTP
nr:MAG TPA: hypothetical protein [Caudoviricetes sp.]